MAGSWSNNVAAAQEAPKAVVVVAGDPDPATQARALEFEAALDEGDIAHPVDPALRGALRGDAGVEDDGLEGARRERRRLGFGEEDAATLVRIGRLTGAHAVVVIQNGAEPSVFDVGATAFFERPTGDVEAFVRRAVRSAARRAAEPTPEPSPEPEVQAQQARAPSPRETAERDTAAEEARARAESTPEPERPARAFFKKNWPYFVAGLLLAGAVTWVIVAGGRDDDVPPPVLRFQPGDVR